MTPATSLREPGDTDLSPFPAVRPPARLVRVSRAARQTWWFSSDGSGRFDLRRPEGTCYFATDAYAAIREASRLGPVSAEWVAGRELRVVAPPDPAARLAATTRRQAGAYGVTAEIATVVPYDVPQRWAAAFRAHRFDGIRHQLRHDQRARPSGASLFGTAGAGDLADGQRIALTARSMHAAGVSVLPPPSMKTLTIVD